MNYLKTTVENKSCSNSCWVFQFVTKEAPNISFMSTFGVIYVNCPLTHGQRKIIKEDPKPNLQRQSRD